MRTIILIMWLILFPMRGVAEDISKLLEYATATVVQIITESSRGSGVIINLNGYVLTNYHVIEDYQYSPSSILILTNSKDKKKVYRIIDYDDDLDIALLRTEALELELPAIIVHPDSVKIGEDVVCIGSPFGFQNYVTKGIISKYTTPYIFTSASINPGNSGGALINMNGELVGMPTMTLRESQNLNFAICPRTIRYFLEKNKIDYNKGEHLR